MKSFPLALALAATIGAAAATTARAAELQFTVTYGENDPGVVEVFDVNTSVPGSESAAGANFIGDGADLDFTVTNDSLGNTLLQVGDSSDSFYFATGTSDADAFFFEPTFTFDAKPSFYDGSSLFLNAASGETALGNDGTSISIEDASAVSAAPEPGPWALLLGGVGILGAFLRVTHARRREDEVKNIATA